MSDSTLPVELIKLAIDRSEAINTYWNLYIAVAGAIVGIIASDKVVITLRLRWIVAAVFIVWALSNLDAIWILNKQRSELCSLLESKSPEAQPLSKELRPHCAYLYVLYHLVLDLGVLGFIRYAKPTARKEQAAEGGRVG
jgi:hypothetical protein